MIIESFVFLLNGLNEEDEAEVVAAAVAAMLLPCNELANSLSVVLIDLFIFSLNVCICLPLWVARG